LGERLKAAREAKGLSSQKAADDLHLDAWVVEALEQGDYARIGPAVYGKGHLKRYAALLALPVAEVLETYEARATLGADALPAAGLGVPPGARSEAQWAKWAGGLALLLIAAAGLARWQPWRAAVNPPPATSKAAPDSGNSSDMTDWADTTNRSPPADGSDAPVIAATDEAARTDQSAAPDKVEVMGQPTRSPAGAPAAPTAGTGQARLRLSFSADSWVDVRDAAGHRLFAGNGRANSVKTIAGDAPMKVYIGSASGVQLAVNNHTVAIGPQFVAGDVARFEAGADGVLRRDAHTAGSVHPPG
jgi:cytoskeleton protein RodZ